MSTKPLTESDTRRASADEDVSHLSVRESGYRQGTRAVVPEGSGEKIRVRLMGWEPGTKVVEGSSADYPVDRIIRDFPETFPAGTRMRANHDSMCESGGDIRRIMAKTVTDPWAEEDGMYADAIVRAGEASDFIREFADVIGTSISAGAEIETEILRDKNGDPVIEDGEPVMVPRKSERGTVIVERFLTMKENPYSAVDFVEVPGADGAIVQLALESAKRVVEGTMIREASGFAIGLAGKRENTSLGKTEGNQTRVTSALDHKEEHMDPETKAAIAALTSSVNEALVKLNAAEEAARKAEADAKAGAIDVSTAVESAVVSLKAISEANLVDEQAAELIEAAKHGEDITEALAKAIKVKAAIESAKSPEGATTSYIHESAKGFSASDFSLNSGGRR